MTIATEHSSSLPASRRKTKRSLYALAGLSAVAGLALLASYAMGSGTTAEIKLDREYRNRDSKVINPSTQSLNRYASTLRDLSHVNVSFEGGKLSVDMYSEDQAHQGKSLSIDNIDARFLVPRLLYDHDGQLDAFDAANLMLGEFARSGVLLSHQKSNELFGVFHSSEGLFDDTSTREYLIEDGMVAPNSKVKPTRLQLVNNCLASGLWEISAVDSVGEMYHGWFDMPKSVYYDMIRSVNGLDASGWQLYWALRYRKDLSNVPFVGERLRTEGELLTSVQPHFVDNKSLTGFSSQDSRRKIQNKFFAVRRDGQTISPATVADLKTGDEFVVKKFVSPGVYSGTKYETIPFKADWPLVEIREVTPHTSYGSEAPSHGDLGHIELTVHEGGTDRAIIVGNIPVSLLVEQEDYQIPSFGVGVLAPSERIERRYLRLKDGPVPHYAYQVEKSEDGSGWRLLNNHHFGYEQVFLRPFKRGNETFLRVTLVSYERILDLVELEVPLTGALKERINQATKQYTPPLYRVYEDPNVL